MKPSVPETGTVIRIEAGKAVVFLQGSHACKGCGAGKIGLCRAGDTSMMLTADNPVAARIGDVVQVGLSSRVQWRGYLLAYFIPLLALLSGAVAGYLAGVPGLEAVLGFGALIGASAFSFRRLRRLDASYSMEVKRVVTDGVFREAVESDEERAFSQTAC